MSVWFWIGVVAYCVVAVFLCGMALGDGFNRVEKWGRVVFWCWLWPIAAVLVLGAGVGDALGFSGNWSSVKTINQDARWRRLWMWRRDSEGKWTRGLFLMYVPEPEPESESEEP